MHLFFHATAPLTQTRPDRCQKSILSGGNCTLTGPGVSELMETPGRESKKNSSPEHLKTFLFIFIFLSMFFFLPSSMCFDIVHAQREQYLAGKYVKNSLVLFQEKRTSSPGTPVELVWWHDNNIIECTTLTRSWELLPLFKKSNRLLLMCIISDIILKVSFFQKIKINLKNTQNREGSVGAPVNGAV